MLKKIFLLTLAFLFLFNLSKSEAFLNKNENPSFLNNIIYNNLYVISGNDFNDLVKVQIQNATANTQYNIFADWGDDDPTSFFQVGTTNTDSSGNAVTSVAHNWVRWTPTTTASHDYAVYFKAIKNGTTEETAVANYTAKVSYINTSLSNNAGIVQNQKVKTGTAVTFTCQNTSEIYFGLKADYPLANKPNQPVNSKYTSPNATTSDYTITYTPTLNTVGEYRLQCSNIGWEASAPTITNFDFEVVPDFATGAITATPNPCVIAIGAGTCQTKLTWSTTNPVGTSGVRSDDPSANTVIADSNNGSASSSVYYPDSNFYLYNNGGAPLASVKVSASCISGSTWDSATSKCKATVTPTFDITNISSSPNVVQTQQNFTWTSTADTCNLYNYDKSSKLATGSKSGSTWTTAISAVNVGSDPGERGYYVKCYDATDYPASTLGVDPDPHTGWSSKYTVTVACQTGYEPDGSGACKASAGSSGTLSASSCSILTGASTCKAGLTWSTTNPVGTPKITSNTPSPHTVFTGAAGSNQQVDVSYGSQTFSLQDDNGALASATVNVACEAGSAWQAGKCQATVSNSCNATYPYNDTAQVCGPATVSCSWVLPGKTEVNCQPQFKCLDFTDPNIKTVSRNGNVETGVANTFTWLADDYLYRFYCPDDSNYKIQKSALKKSYSHFLTFNLSASSVKKGTGINMNWIIEEPNDSCQIVGTSLKTNATVFDTKGQGEEKALNSYIATSTNYYASSDKYQAMAEYKDKMGSYWTVNQSTKFVASCNDTGNYLPGAYQVTKEIHVIDESE